MKDLRTSICFIPARSDGLRGVLKSSASFGGVLFASMLAATANAQVANDPAASGAQQAPAPAVQQPAATPAEAPVSADPGVGDIVVTAQKRSTSIQKTPISITALSGDALGKSQVRTLKDLEATVPGLAVADYAGTAQITIRGIGVSATGAGADPAVAYNLNDIYISRQLGLLGNIYDVSSVEVLRGPQGTLYGRNATAGAINTSTTRPDLDKWSGYVRGSVGNYTAVNVEAAAGGPVITDKLAVRVAGFVDRRDGYGINIGTGNDIDDRNAKGVRGTIVAKPTEDFTATLIADYYHQRDHSGSSHYFASSPETGLPGAWQGLPSSQLFGGVPNTRIRDTAGGFDPQMFVETYSATGILEWRSGDFSLKSITGYRHLDFGITYPIDGGTVLTTFVVQREKARQVSQEVQAHYDTSRLHATLGLYYFDENDNAGPLSGILLSTLLYPALGQPAPANPFFVDFAEFGGRLKTKAKAVFGQVDYEVVPDLTLTAGLRYSSESKQLDNYTRTDLSLTIPSNFNPANPLATTPTGALPVTSLPKATFNSTTPRVGIQYQATPSTMLYANFSKGFKSGGFDVTTIAPPFNPEKIDAYEAGVKTRLFDGRVRVSAAGFYYKYDDLQVQQIIGFQVQTANAGKATIKGAEIQISARPTDSLIVELNGNYLDARYDEFMGTSAAQPLLTSNVDFSGNRLNNAPRFTGYMSIEKLFPLSHGEVSLKGEVQGSSRFFFSPDNIGLVGQGAYAKGNAYLSYRSNDNWTLTAFVRNITDRVTKTSANVSTFLAGAPINGSVSPPRTYGIQAQYNF